MSNRIECDVLIVGTGIGGGSAAVVLANHGLKVVILKRSDVPRESNTSNAQGGIIGRGDDDTPDLLARDIDRAGDEVGSLKAIQILSEEGPKLVDDFLIENLRVPFDTDAEGNVHRTYEAAHARARIIHRGDQTGWEIQKGINRALEQHPNIMVLENHTAIDLISSTHHTAKRGAEYGPTRILGAYVLDRASREVKTILASRTILATGGIGAIWDRTSNPEGARGDGIAMANRAGATVINMHYMQFHPTAFAGGKESFLISEAVRGEGGILRDLKGERFMFKYVPEESRGEIAESEEEANRWYGNKQDKTLRRPPELLPRDEVTRAIQKHMRTHQMPHVLLDLSLIRERGVDLEKRFPDIFSWCLRNGVDIRKDNIPVAPAAHYLCGGIRVDEFGRTDIENLYAVGECSCTGLHGANRLASTSLLEGLVWGVRSARHIALSVTKESFAEWQIPDWDYHAAAKPVSGNECAYRLDRLKRIMWEHAGIVRSSMGLAIGLRIVAHMRIDAEETYWKHRPSDELIGLYNAVQVAELVMRDARRDRVSRGCHYRED